MEEGHHLAPGGATTAGTMVIGPVIAKQGIGAINAIVVGNVVISNEIAATVHAPSTGTNVAGHLDLVHPVIGRDRDLLVVIEELPAEVTAGAGATAQGRPTGAGVQSRKIAAGG